MSKYDITFKIAVVIAYSIGEGGHKSVSNKFSITDKSPVRKWVKIYEMMGESGLK